MNHCFRKKGMLSLDFSCNAHRGYWVFGSPLSQETYYFKSLFPHKVVVRLTERTAEYFVYIGNAGPTILLKMRKMKPGDSANEKGTKPHSPVTAGPQKRGQVDPGAVANTGEIRQWLTPTVSQSAHIIHQEFLNCQSRQLHKNHVKKIMGRNDFSKFGW